MRAGDDPVFVAEVEAAEGTHVIWSDLPPNPEYLPCRVVTDPVDHAYYLSGYEASRERSPFNHRLYARVNRPGEIVVLFGRTRFSKAVGGLASRELSAAEVRVALRDDVGLSEALIERWIASGASTPPCSRLAARRLHRREGCRLRDGVPAAVPRRIENSRQDRRQG